MSDAALATALIEAIASAAHVEVGAVALASFSLERLAPGDASRTEARIDRKTRTLIFASAEAVDANGTRIAMASAVLRITSAT